jgi:F-type H+-transporting ATPase subunit alpha
MIYAVTNGFLDDVATGEVRRWEAEFLDFLRSTKPAVGTAIRTRKSLDDELKQQIEQAVRDFKALR